MVNIAVRAARAAGNLIVRHAERAADLEVTAKGMNDFVTAVDRQAEGVIIDVDVNAYRIAPPLPPQAFEPVRANEVYPLSSLQFEGDS